MKKEIYTKKKVPCRYYLEEGASIEHCKESCTFFNGMDETSVDCLCPEIPVHHCHVTSFIMNGYLYKAREYDKEKDGPLKNDDYCEKCCFGKTLQNGNGVCLLRYGIDDDNHYFTCYDDEIWEKFKYDTDGADN